MIYFIISNKNIYILKNIYIKIHIQNICYKIYIKITITCTQITENCTNLCYTFSRAINITTGAQSVELAICSAYY